MWNWGKGRAAPRTCPGEPELGTAQWDTSLSPAGFVNTAHSSPALQPGPWGIPDPRGGGQDTGKVWGMLVHLVVTSKLQPGLPSQPSPALLQLQGWHSQGTHPELGWQQDALEEQGTCLAVGKGAVAAAPASSSSQQWIFEGKVQETGSVWGFSMVRPAILAFFLLPPV